MIRRRQRVSALQQEDISEGLIAFLLFRQMCVALTVHEYQESAGWRGGVDQVAYGLHYRFNLDCSDSLCSRSNRNLGLVWAANSLEEA